MRATLRLVLIAGLLLARGVRVAGAQAPAAAQPKTFDVASVKPSPPLDMAKMQASMQSGKMPNFGAHVSTSRAEYNFMALRDLIATAYKVKPYQVTGPSWITTERFDVVAKMPEGASKDDAPGMLRALLEERFKLKVHLDTQEHPVLALVVGKGGPKMKESLGDTEPLDLDSPLKPGETQMDTPDGPARMTIDRSGGGATMNMGKKGIITYSMDQQSMMLKMTSSKTTMEALADMLTQMMTQMAGGGSSQQVVDMTG